MADYFDKYYKGVVGTGKNYGATLDTPYCTFAELAREVFRDHINWGRIVAFFTLGHEAVLVAIKKGDQDVKTFWHYIDSFVGAFLRETETESWIKQEGGWVSTILAKIIPSLDL